MDLGLDRGGEKVVIFLVHLCVRAIYIHSKYTHPPSADSLHKTARLIQTENLHSFTTPSTSKAIRLFSDFLP